MPSRRWFELGGSIPFLRWNLTSTAASSDKPNKQNAGMVHTWPARIHGLSAYLDSERLFGVKSFLHELPNVGERRRPVPRRNVTSWWAKLGKTWRVTKLRLELQFHSFWRRGQWICRMVMWVKGACMMTRCGIKRNWTISRFVLFASDVIGARMLICSSLRFWLDHDDVLAYRCFEVLWCWQSPIRFVTGFGDLSKDNFW